MYANRIKFNLLLFEGYLDQHMTKFEFENSFGKLKCLLSDKHITKMLFIIKTIWRIFACALLCGNEILDFSGLTKTNEVLIQADSLRW